MATKSDVKLKRPSNVALRTAAMLMEGTFDAFENAKFAFALVVYEAGNRDKESFRLAMREALKGSWRSWKGRINLSDSSANDLFALIEYNLRQMLDDQYDCVTRTSRPDVTKPFH